MKRRHGRTDLPLAQRWPASAPCACPTCLAYCVRPGWWTVAEAQAAIQAGYGARMMLEFSPDRTWGVLSPAFVGCEEGIATREAAARGCCFLLDGRCELHGTGHQPLECRYCHHERRGMGPRCHADLERDWRTPAGQALVARWCEATNLRARLLLAALPPRR